MIAAELAQRRFVQLKKNLAQCLGFRMPGSETLSVNLTQRLDGRVSVFVADFTVVVAVAIIETCVAAGSLPCAFTQRPSSCPDQMAILRRNLASKRGLIAQSCRPWPFSGAGQGPLSAYADAARASSQYAPSSDCRRARQPASGTQ